MIEKVLILTPFDLLATKLTQSLLRWKVESVECVSDYDAAQAIDFNAEGFTSLVVGKRFMGDILDTAIWVRWIRTKYGGPIIGINDALCTGGDMRLLQVAGCNYLVSTVEEVLLIRGVCTCIQEIESLSNQLFGMGRF